MSTALEDRLTAALEARAALVQPEDLRHQAPGTHEPRPLWRRPVVAALVAAAAVAAIAVPLLLRGGDTHETPQPSHPISLPPDHVPSTRFPAPVPKTTARLSGDIDGDGLPDEISAAGDTITVRLASRPARPLTYRDQDLQGLAGLLDTGSPGQGIVEVSHDQASGSSWYVIALRRGALKLLPGSNSTVATVPGYWTSWLTPAGVLMSGRLDPMQQGERRLAVDASRVEVRSGHVHTVPVGRLCWDVVTQQVPTACPAGVDDAFDPGPHGSLPALLPRFSVQHTLDRFGTWRDGSTSLHFTEGPVHAQSSFEQEYDLEGTIDGRPVSAPAGTFSVSLFKTFVDLGHGVRGLAVSSQTAGGSVWNLLAHVGGRLVPLPVAGDPQPSPYGLHPGADNLVAHGHGHLGETWIGPQGRVFTSVALGNQGYVELYEWRVTDSTATALEPVDLGEICMDQFWGTYGTCAGSR